MNQQQFDELVALVGKQREGQCPQEDGKGVLVCQVCWDFMAGPVEESWKNCGGEGKVTDPQAQAAWEVLHWQCDWPKYTHTHYVHYEYDPDRESDTYECGDWIPHDIKYWPDGAVRGMLIEAGEELLWERFFHKAGVTSADDKQRLRLSPTVWSNSTEALFTAFKQALEGRTVASPAP